VNPDLVAVEIDASRQLAVAFDVIVVSCVAKPSLGRTAPHRLGFGDLAVAMLVDNVRISRTLGRTSAG
jgi:hypothetical protein